MVNHWTRLLAFATWCILSAPGLAALRLEAPSGAIEYGQSFTITLRTADAATAVQRLDLTPLADDFRIERVVPGAAGVLVTLNPRRTGTLEIPSLWLADERSAAVTVEITPAVDAGHTVVVRSRISAQSVWEREQLLVVIEVRSRERFFALQAPEFRAPGLTVVPLQSGIRRERMDGIDYTVRTAGWALFANTAGAYELELPPVALLRGGRVQARFALPRYRAHARALPPYVPPDMPVGALTLSTKVEASQLLHTDTLAFWELQIHGRGVPATALPSPLAPVRSSKQAQFLPAEPQYRQQADADGLTSTLIYRIPFEARRSGPVTLPGLALQYFDPGSARLVRIEPEPTRLWALASGWRALLAAAMLAAVAYSGTRLLRAFYRRAQLARRRRALLTEIEQAPDTRQVRWALIRFGNDQGWRLNGSLQNWRLAFERHYGGVEADLERLLEQLNRCEFSPEAPGESLAESRAQLCKVLRRARPRRKRRTRSQSAWLNNSSGMPPAAPK